MSAAAMNGLPLLREELDLLAGPELPDGQPSWTLHDPVRNLFFRIDWLTFEILSRWSLGSPQAIAEMVAVSTPLNAAPTHVEEVVRFLTENQLVRPLGRDSADKLAERLKKIEGSPFKWLLHHYLFFRVPLWRPDAWLERWRPVADLLYTRAFALLTLAALGMGLVQVFRHSDQFFSSLVDTFNWEGLVAYGVAVFCVKWLHELGHAFTAKRYGCRIPAMGVAFLVLWPMAYTDTNETWRLTSQWQRFRIACAGIATELVIAAWATLAWALLPDGGLRGAAFVLATTSWVATVAINASPFLRFDGYFILCDLLDMPNLHGRSFALARWKLREWLFALGEPKPEHFSRRKEAWLIAFAWVTWLYRLVVFLGIALLVYHFFFKALGIFLFVVEIIWFIALPVYRELQAWKERLPAMRARPESRRRTWRSLALLLVLLSLFALPWPGRVATTGLLRPAQMMPIYTQEGAVLEQLAFADGEAVQPGAELLTMKVPDLALRQALAEARSAGLRWQAATVGLNAETRARLLVSQEEWATAEAELEAATQALAQQRPLAPFEGELRIADPELQPGQWLPAKMQVAVVIGHQGALVETYLDESEVQRVRVGDAAIFVTDGAEGPVIRLRVETIDTDATRVLPDGLFAAVAGGHILTRDRNGQRVPEKAIYRVVLGVESPLDALEGRMWRGRVVIRAASEAPIARYLRNLLAVLVRESGW